MNAQWNESKRVQLESKPGRFLAKGKISGTVREVQVIVKKSTLKNFAVKAD